MKKVNFTYSNGRYRRISVREAEILHRLGKGSYLTREVVSGGAMSINSDPRAGRGEIDLDRLGLEELRSLAHEIGVKVHHKSGAEKLRASIREAAE